MKKWAIYQDTYGKYARHYIDGYFEIKTPDRESHVCGRAFG